MKQVEGAVVISSTQVNKAPHLLVIGTSPPDPDGNFSIAKLLLKLLECSDDTSERGGHIGEVGDSSTDDEHLNGD